MCSTAVTPGQSVFTADGVTATTQQGPGTIPLGRVVAVQPDDGVQVSVAEQGVVVTMPTRQDGGIAATAEQVQRAINYFGSGQIILGGGNFEYIVSSPPTVPHPTPPIRYPLTDEAAADPTTASLRRRVSEVIEATARCLLDTPIRTEHDGTITEQQAQEIEAAMNSEIRRCFDGDLAVTVSRQRTANGHLSLNLAGEVRGDREEALGSASFALGRTRGEYTANG